MHPYQQYGYAQGAGQPMGQPQGAMSGLGGAMAMGLQGMGGQFAPQQQQGGYPMGQGFDQMAGGMGGYPQPQAQFQQPGFASQATPTGDDMQMTGVVPGADHEEVEDENELTENERAERRIRRRAKKRRQLVRQIICYTLSITFSCTLFTSAILSCMDILKIGTAYVEFEIEVKDDVASEVLTRRLMDPAALKLPTVALTGVMTTVYYIEMIQTPGTPQGQVLYGNPGIAEIQSVNSTCDTLSLLGSVNRMLASPCVPTPKTVGTINALAGYRKLWGSGFAPPGDYNILRLHFCPKGSTTGSKIDYATSTAASLSAPIPCIYDMPNFRLRVSEGQRKRIYLTTVLKNLVRTKQGAVPKNTACGPAICGISPTFTVYNRTILRNSFMDLPVCAGCSS